MTYRECKYCGKGGVEDPREPPSPDIYCSAKCADAAANEEKPSVPLQARNPESPWHTLDHLQQRVLMLLECEGPLTKRQISRRLNVGAYSKLIMPCLCGHCVNHLIAIARDQ